MVIMPGTVPCPSLSSIGTKIEFHPTNVSFVQALNDKYVDQEEFDNHFKVPRDQSISTEITFVGFGSVSSVQKQLRRLVSIDLSGRNIKTSGNLADISGSLDRVTILNLADNYLTWQETIKILSCLPNLQELILSGNDLKANEDINLTRPFKKLISITLGRIDQDWTSIITTLSRIWTSIDQVDLWDNHLTGDSLILLSDNSFVGRIVSLKLSHNCFPDLRWTTNVGKFDSLEELDVSRCQIESIDLDRQIVNQLKNLSLLNISYNNITSWSSISTLNQLSRLRHLICNDNPLTITEKTAKAFTVARIASLTQLNREEVTPPLRRDFEIQYLRHTFKELQEHKDIALDRIHPRYSDLVETYGTPEDLNARQTIERYITVELCLGDKSIAKKLPCDMRVSNLHMLCKRLFKLKPSVDIEIICCDDKSTDGAVSYPLDKEGQTLHFFSVKNNNRLMVNEVD